MERHMSQKSGKINDMRFSQMTGVGDKALHETRYKILTDTRWR